VINDEVAQSDRQPLHMSTLTKRDQYEGVGVGVHNFQRASGLTESHADKHASRSPVFEAHLYGTHSLDDYGRHVHGSA
jgi:hypothetical protein